MIGILRAGNDDVAVLNVPAQDDLRGRFAVLFAQLGKGRRQVDFPNERRQRFNARSAVASLQALGAMSQTFWAKRAVPAL